MLEHSFQAMFRVGECYGQHSSPNSFEWSPQGRKFRWPETEPSEVPLPLAYYKISLKSPPDFYDKYCLEMAVL